MKTILVPIDFSEDSENAAHYAAELAKFSGSKIVLLHIYSLPVPIVENPVSDVQYEEIGTLNKELLKSLEAKLRSVHGNIEIEAISTVGFTIEEIRYYSETKKADIVVMGISEAGKSVSSFGNITTSTIKESACPVLIIPGNARFKKPSRIALACDYSSILPDEIIEKFKAIVKLFNAKVLVFDVLKTTELVNFEKAMAEHSLEESFQDINHSVYFPSGDDLVKETNSFINKHMVDMLVMIPHKYSFFSGMFHRSNTKQMALNTHVPLLTIHE